MTYRIVFSNTGDEIPFDPVNQELLDFYIDQLALQNYNNFTAFDPDLGQIILNKIQNLKACVLEINALLKDLSTLRFPVLELEQYLNQSVLNKMHEDWAKAQNQIYDIQKKRLELNYSELAEKIHDAFPDHIQTPPLTVVLQMLGLDDIYYSLNNPHIHELEGMFSDLRFKISETWTKIADNHFSKNMLSNDLANISLSFNHLGRTLFNKFCNYDVNLEFDDENSFNELLGYVTLSLQPSQTIPFSKEYVNWCHNNNRQPIGNNLNIGNIPNLAQNLTTYRIIVLRNLLAKNTFSIYKG
jgi:hypothetical protein